MVRVLRPLAALEHDTSERGKPARVRSPRGTAMMDSSTVWHRRRGDFLHRAGAVVLLFAIGAVAACHHAPAEQQIRQAIESAAAAARANDPSGVLAVVSDDFTGNDGDLDRRGLHRLLALRALRQDRTGILLGPITFERKADRIVASFKLVLTGGKPGDLLSEQSSIRTMTTAWRREDGKWRCYSANWSR
jgi:ketosteroid isomerase-like protein